MSSQDRLLMLSPSEISLNPFQPRKEFEEEELDQLAQSIRAVGLIQPLVVRPLNIHNNQFELIAGERRLRAAQRAGLQLIPAFVRHLNHSLSAEAALIENLQRVDLNPIEIAMAIKRLMHELNLKQEEVALKVGKKRSTVANYLRLLSLSALIQESLSQKKISMGHAKVILSLDSAAIQEILHEAIIKDELSVKKTEQLALKLSQKPAKPPSLRTRNFYLEQLTETIQHKYQTRVEITESGDQKGKISIHYHSLDDLDRILELFGLHSSL